MPEPKFHTGGHLSPDSPAYVERPFVAECFSALSGGAWVALLGPRQHGKTSGLVRLLDQLRAASVQAARVSLQGIPPVADYPALLTWIARQIARQFKVRLEPPDELERDELDAWLAAALPDGAAQIVVCFDEAAGVRDPSMRSDLYRQLRRLHDSRDSPSAPSLGRGLALLFSGTFEPKRLVEDDLTSPFNVCKRVETQDLTLEDAHTLVTLADGEQARDFVDRAFELVGGQPLLLQQLFAAAAAGDDAIPAADRYVRLEQRLLLGDSDHLRDLVGTVVSDPPMRTIATDVLASASGADYIATPDHNLLCTIGFARIDDNRLVARNALYEKVAVAHPMLAAKAVALPQGQVAPPAAGTFAFVADPNLRRFADEMIAGAFTALNAGHRRLALVGLGSVLEALLIDVLEQSAADLATARGQAEKRGATFQKWEQPTVPSTWRLVNLVKVADRLPALSGSSIAAADSLRDFRNRIHPAKERTASADEAALDPETQTAQGVIGILTRELGRALP